MHIESKSNIISLCQLSVKRENLTLNEALHIFLILKLA